MKRHEFWAIVGTGVALLAVCVAMWVTMWTQIAENGRQMATRAEIQAMDGRFQALEKTLAELVAAMERIDGKLDVVVPLVTEGRGP